MQSEWRDPPRVIKGFPVGPDGRVHTTFTHNPSSLRLSSTDPNLQNIPRGNDSEVARWVKECFVAPLGYSFWDRDYSGIEAVLVGYFAGSARYIRLAKLGVHAYMASHVLARPADLAWSDTDLKSYFKLLKRESPTVYDIAKRIVHGSNYVMTPRKMNYEWPEQFPTVKGAAALQGLYFELFPEIRAWHKDLCVRVDATKRRHRDADQEKVDPWSLGVCTVRNPFSYLHRFYNVLDWERVIDGEKKEWIWKYGEDAKRLVSFLPQSTAAAIIKRAGKRLWYDYPDVGRTMRLWIHDSILGEQTDEKIGECLEISRVVMEEPIPQLPLPIEWGMGEFLSIGTEGKSGKSWATLE